MSLRMLMVGLGSIGKKHLKALQGIREVEVFALRNRPDSPPVDGVTSVFDKEKIPVQLDFVLIANPTSLHAETLDWALNLACPIFLEKPPFSDLDHVSTLLAKAEKNNTTTYIGCNLRFFDSLVFLKNYLKKSPSKIEEVNVYAGSYLPDWRPGSDFRTVYSAHSEQGGGVHLDLFHELDYTCYLFGLPVFSQGFTSSSSHLNISAVDYAHYLLHFGDFSATITLNYFRKKPKRTIEIVRESDVLRLDILTNTVYQNDEVVFTSEQSVLDTYEAQMRYFLSCIEKGEKAANDLQFGVDVLKICLNQKNLC